MDPKLLQYLIDADDPLRSELPLSFDWKAAIDRVRNLQPTCERIADRLFELDDQVQDASFFADLVVRAWTWDPRVRHVAFALRFSCFGDLFTTWGPTGEDRLPQAVTNKLVMAAVAAGFAFVPPDALEEPYAGAHPAFQGQTWWYRFFDYI